MTVCGDLAAIARDDPRRTRALWDAGKRSKEVDMDMRRKRISFPLLAVSSIALCVGWACSEPALAIEALPPGVTSVSCSPGNQFVGGVPAGTTLACDETDAFGNTGIATAGASLAPPGADAQAHAQWDPQTPGTVAGASAGAEVTYYARILPTQGTAFLTGLYGSQLPVPILVHASLFAEATGGVSYANAAAWVILDELVSFTASAYAAGVTSETVTQSKTGILTISLLEDATPFTLFKAAGCAIEFLGTGGPMSGDCQAQADPQISFDQGAFDTWAASGGTDTITLVDYFAIEYSPNVTPVPEPASWALMAGGLLLLASRMRRRIALC